MDIISEGKVIAENLSPSLPFQAASPLVRGGLECCHTST